MPQRDARAVSDGLQLDLRLRPVAPAAFLPADGRGRRELYDFEGRLSRTEVDRQPRPPLERSVRLDRGARGEPLRHSGGVGEEREDQLAIGVDSVDERMADAPHRGSTSSGGSIGECSYTIGRWQTQSSGVERAICTLALGGRYSIFVGSVITPPQKLQWVGVAIRVPAFTRAEPQSKRAVAKKSQRLVTVLGVTLACALSGTAASAQDWPRFGWDVGR